MRITPPVVMSLGSLILLFAVKVPVELVGGISIVLAYLVVNAQVDIRTGDRTVLDYLLKPLRKTLAGSLGER